MTAQHNSAEILKAILFDMDGVLINTIHSVRQLWSEVALEFGAKLAEADYKNHVYGCTASHTMDHLFPQLSIQDRQKILHKIEIYETNLTFTAADGALALLQQLKINGVPTALVTSADPWKANRVLHQLNASHLFTTVITSDDIKKGKPDPECYRKAAQKLCVPIQQCLVIEDSDSGLKAAIASGATTVAVQNDYQNLSNFRNNILAVITGLAECETIEENNSLFLKIQNHYLNLQREK